MSLSLRIPILASLFVVLTACSPLDLAGSLLGGGPNVNAQVGATNQQGINVTTQAPRVSIPPKARVDTIDQSTTNNGVPWSWFFVFLVTWLIGWLMDSPQTILKNLFSKKD